MGSLINSVSRRLGIPVGYKLHKSFTMPIVKDLRSFLDLWGWVSSVPVSMSSSSINGCFVGKRNFHLYQTLESWVSVCGYRFIRMCISDSVAVVGIHLYVFGITFGISQFSSGFVFANLFSSVLSVSFLECSLELLYQDWFKNNLVVSISIHNVFLFIIGSYFSFVQELNVFLKMGYSGRFSNKVFSEGVVIVVSLFQLPYPTLLVKWLCDFIEQDERVNLGISFLKEALICFDPFLYKLRGFSLSIKGRVGGLDKSMKQAIRWGQMPLETLSAGVVSSMGTAFTAYGVIGIRVSLYYGLSSISFVVQW